jgi:hypothetical protein
MNMNWKDIEAANVSETGTHDDSFVAMLLEVVEYLLHRLNPRIIVAHVILSGCFFIPIKNLRYRWI